VLKSPSQIDRAARPAEGDATCSRLNSTAEEATSGSSAMGGGSGGWRRRNRGRGGVGGGRNRGHGCRGSTRAHDEGVQHGLSLPLLLHLPGASTTGALVNSSIAARRGRGSQPYASGLPQILVPEAQSAEVIASFSKAATEVR
jgi:hypothetical protein